MTEWSNADKAQWHLEHGYPDLIWVRERVGDQIYKRAFLGRGKLPPWQEPVLERELDFNWSKHKT
jgi:hypothetical protein